MADGYAALEDGLKAGLHDLLYGSEPGVKEEVLDEYDFEDLYEMGRQAVRLAIAPALWDHRLGQMLDTSGVCALLNVTRQAVAKKVAAGSLIALPSGKTRRFPVWQFVPGGPGTVRPEVAAIIEKFEERYPQVTATQLAAWAVTRQPELEDETPARWLEAARPIEPLLLAAQRAGAALAQ